MGHLKPTLWIAAFDYKFLNPYTADRTPSSCTTLSQSGTCTLPEEEEDLEKSNTYSETVDSRYLERGYLEVCESQSVYLNQKYILLLSRTIIWRWILFTSPNYPKCKLICTSGNLNLKKIVPPTSRYRELTVNLKSNDSTVELFLSDLSSS